MNAHIRLLAVVATCAAFAAPARAAESWPLPDAPLRLVIPDVRAFDAALGGSFRAALTGTVSESDPAVAAWRQTQVGAKLLAQWEKLEGDLPWTWNQVVALEARSLGLALLDVGHLETVVAISSPLAALPSPLAKGRTKNHGGVAYQVVAAGAGDAGPAGAGSGATDEDGERRMGLAWARVGEWVLIATSERALVTALDTQSSGHGTALPLAGLVSMELDLDRLRKDRYFKREFLFEPGPESGRMRAALRRDGERFVEVREGVHETRKPGYDFDAGGAALAGWEGDGAGLWSALRSGILEPVPEPSATPRASLGVLPAATLDKNDDRYLVSFVKPLAKPGAPTTDAGELTDWAAWLDKNPASGWAYVVDRDGTRRIGVPWPAGRDEELLALSRATAVRRAGRVEVVNVGDAREVRAGADLPMVAIRRVGELVWIGPSAKALGSAPAATKSPDRVRWARLDLREVRAQIPRWEKAEGPAAPEQVRALSDRIAGMLGWVPSVASAAVERRLTASGWTETVTLAP